MQPPVYDEIDQLAQYYVSEVAQLFTSQNIADNNYQINTPSEDLRAQADKLAGEIRMFINKRVTQAVENVDVERKAEQLQGLEDERNDIRATRTSRERGAVAFQADSTGVATAPQDNNIS